MSDDQDAYVPSFEFTCPPASSSIENTFRMAQVLEKKGDTDAAISKYLLVCESLERTISLIPSATVDIRLAVFSLGNISDIYESRGDWDKSLAFRKCQRQFLEYFRRHRHLTLGEEEDAGVDFSEVTSTAASLGRLFAGIANARATKERPPPEAPEKLLRRFHDAVTAEREAQADRIAEMLDRATEARDVALTNSFWKRSVRRAADHPWMLILVAFVIGVVIVLAVALRPKKRRMLPPEMAKRLQGHPSQETGGIENAGWHRKPRAGSFFPEGWSQYFRGHNGAE
jgi:hypothetical protein